MPNLHLFVYRQNGQKNTIIPNKKASDEAKFKNGASNGLNFEPVVNDIVKFSHLCLHEEDTIEQIKKFINCNNS